jgi:hypothetical protein
MKRVKLISKIVILAIICFSLCSCGKLFFRTGYDDVDPSDEDEEVSGSSYFNSPSSVSITSDSEVVQNSSGESVNNSLSNTSVSSSESSETTIPKLPEDWPLPFNDKIVLDLSVAKDADGFKVWDIEGTYPGSAEEIYNWYKEKLTGWTVEDDSASTHEDNTKMYEYQISNVKYKALLSFVDSGENESKFIFYVEEQ